MKVLNIKSKLFLDMIIVHELKKTDPFLSDIIPL